jgi:predicted nucleic acid-binding protein
MEWLDALSGQVIGLDTAPLIYFIEENPAYLNFVRPFFEMMDRGEARVVTSVITLAEVLVHPLRSGDAALVQRYRDILQSAAALTLLPVSEAIAEQAAHLRARHNLRTPDAIQLATALQSGASTFLTNDARLPTVPGLHTITLDDLLLLMIFVLLPSYGCQRVRE